MRVIGAKVKLWVIGAGIAVAVLAACVPMVHWVTPKGQPLTDARCSSHEAATGGGPEVCKFRSLRDIARDKEKCGLDGGYYRDSGLTGFLSACVFPNADDGKSCSRSTDCEGECAAETRTCRDAGLAGGLILDAHGNEMFGPVE